MQVRADPVALGSALSVRVQRSSCRRPSDDVSKQRGPSTASSVKRTRALDVSLLCVQFRVIFGRSFELRSAAFDRYRREFGTYHVAGKAYRCSEVARSFCECNRESKSEREKAAREVEEEASVAT